MSAPKFTPGLIVERIGADASQKERGMQFRIIDPNAGDARDREVAILYHKPHIATAQGYAHLFASAPELYAALACLLDDVPAMRAEVVKLLPPGAWDRYLAAREQARSALGKAGGA